MSIEFQIGKQVVCLKDGWFNKNARCFKGCIWPVKDGVYTIRDIRKDSEDSASFLFEEIRNPTLTLKEGMTEIRFVTRNFRPVKDTSIDDFTAMLSPAPTKEKENV